MEEVYGSDLAAARARASQTEKQSSLNTVKHHVWAHGGRGKANEMPGQDLERKRGESYQPQSTTLGAGLGGEMDMDSDFSDLSVVWECYISPRPEAVVELTDRPVQVNLCEAMKSSGCVTRRNRSMGSRCDEADKLTAATAKSTRAGQE